MRQPATASTSAQGPVFFGTIAEFEAYEFGERMILRQTGMISRVGRVLAAIQRRAAAGDDIGLIAARLERQLADYTRRNLLMRAHRDALWALADRGSAVIQ